MKAQQPVGASGSGSAGRTISSTYQVAAHRVLVSGRDSAWIVDLDDRTLPGSFPSEAAAWEAAVREADRLDRLAAR